MSPMADMCSHTLYHQRPDSVLEAHTLRYHEVDPAAVTIDEIAALTPKPKGRDNFSSFHVIHRGAGATAVVADARCHVYELPETHGDPVAEYNAIFAITSELVLKGADRASLLVYVGQEGGAEDGFGAFFGMLPFRGVQLAMVTRRGEYGNPLRMSTPSGCFVCDTEDTARMGMYPVKAMFGPLAGREFRATIAPWRPVDIDHTASAELTRLPFKIGGLDLPMLTHDGSYEDGVAMLADALVRHYADDAASIFPVVSCGETVDAIGYGWDVQQGLAARGHEGYYFAHRSGETYKSYEEYGDAGLLRRVHAAQRAGRRVVFIAVGGGVNGNCTGLLAAITGADLVEVPTTPMHYNDATTSAKKAFSLVVDGKILSKNILGAFYLPQLVFCINETLLTISSSSVHATVGEATKTMNMLGIANSSVGQRDYHNILGAGEFASDFTSVILTARGFDRFVRFIEHGDQKALKEQMVALGGEIGRARAEGGDAAVLAALQQERRALLKGFLANFRRMEGGERASVQNFLTTINLEVVKAKAMFLSYSDPFEKYRALLFEYAHTLGHGLEAYMNGLYEEARKQGVEYADAVRQHGQCVGMAVVWAGHMSSRLGVLSGNGLHAHQSLVYLFNGHGGFNFRPLRRLCEALGVPKEDFIEGVLKVVRRDNKRGYTNCSGCKSVDQLVAGRPGKMLGSEDPNAEVRYLVEVDEAWQASVLGLAFDCEFDLVADLQGEKVVFVDQQGERQGGPHEVAVAVHASVRQLYSLETPAQAKRRLLASCGSMSLDNLITTPPRSADLSV
eukprot:TRINITY_DN1126_c0_g1_i1.p1 TRINITY_DN1126_c0_g1~~TRINITY_DN1126_c0_g1_i1.p1  ORF type:complete len:792 (+),score=422.84 TRINITY_DN1126_c0_g1_i1:74-2449(+)